LFIFPCLCTGKITACAFDTAQTACGHNEDTGEEMRFFGCYGFIFEVYIHTAVHSRSSFYNLLQNIGVDKYRSPVSGSMATIFLPLFSGRFASSVFHAAGRSEIFQLAVHSRTELAVPFLSPHFSTD